MTTDNSEQLEKVEKVPFWRRFKKPGKQMFWAWIAYQSIKGTLTLSFIWIPLFWAWLHRG